MTTTDDILLELSFLGSDQTKKVLTRHGAREPFFGVKVEDLKKIVKEVKRAEKGQGADAHRLALELYATGNSDAMYLAGLLADPKRMDKPTLNQWVDGAYWHMISGFTVPWATAESPVGWEIALEWIGSGREMTATAGWATLGSIVSVTPDQQLDIPKLKELIALVCKTIHQSANRVRYSMNTFLISTGSYVPELTELCKSTALTVGKVMVDVGGTSCKVPYAPDYISKVENMGKIGQKRKMVGC
ncbi:MAG: DNA alkylation repair protein [Bacteroidetes bacterium GWF2_49_14]|nr:MAG: DNA alkylation repair protein [Bacteroidetes bacterium GWF2_49_14]HBB90511.1 DNA alkylation repair protein [Bacteroidales bacterium]